MMGTPEQRRAHRLTREELAALNEISTPEIIAQFQQLGQLNDDQAARLVGVDSQYISVFQELLRRIPEVAQVSRSHQGSLEQLCRALLAARLLTEYLEILVPPHLSYDKTPQGTVDLLEALL